MLPEWINVEQAVKKLERIVRKAGMVDDANAALEEGQGRLTLLPGFNVFTRSEDMAPYTWCVPRPRHGDWDILNVWEEYVDRDLGLVRNPGKLARSAVRANAAIRYMGRSRPASRWRMPLVKLIAVAQHCTANPVVVQGNGVSLQLDEFRLEVTPRGAWSNLRRAMKMAAKPAVDLGYDDVTVEAIRTAHPLASFVSDRFGDEVLWLANVVVQAERYKLIPAVRFSVAPARHHGPKKGLPVPVDVLGAIHACQEILAGPSYPGMIFTLFEAAVPRLMTAKKFQKMISDPYRSNAGRMVSPARKAEWARRIDAYVEQLQRQDD